jgi:hypothetical protein
MATTCTNCGVHVGSLANYGSAEKPLCFKCQDDVQKCSLCNNPLAQGETPAQIDGQPYCAACYGKTRSGRPSESVPATAEKKETEIGKKAVIDENPPDVFQDAALSIPLDVIFLPDTEIELLQVEGNAVRIRLPDGRTGYVNGNTSLSIVKRCWMNADQANAFATPSASSAVSRIFNKGEEFSLLNLVEKEGQKWIRIRDAAGGIHYMSGKTMLITEESLIETIGKLIGSGISENNIVKQFAKQKVPEHIVRDFYAKITAAAKEYKNSDEGRKTLAAQYARHMLYGVLWVVGGIIATVIGYSAASSSGGSYYVFWGAVVFGIYDFFKGLFGWIKYSSK